MELLDDLKSVVEKSDRFYFKERSFKIQFSGGALDEGCYIPKGDIAFWNLIATSYAAEQKIFFVASEVDGEPVCQVYGDHRGFCLFKDNYDGEVYLYGDIDIRHISRNLVIFSEISWGLTYFIPETAFVNFESLINNCNRVLRDGAFCEYTLLKQDYPSLGLTEADLPELPISW